MGWESRRKKSIPGNQYSMSKIQSMDCVQEKVSIEIFCNVGAYQKRKENIN